MRLRYFLLIKAPSWLIAGQTTLTAQIRKKS